MPAQHRRGVLRAVRAWLLWRCHGRNARGLPALCLPADQPREHVGVLAQGPGRNSRRGAEGLPGLRGRVKGAGWGGSVPWPDLCLSVPGSPAPVRAWRLVGTAARPVNLATPASTVSSKFANGKGEGRARMVTPDESPRWRCSERSPPGLHSSP